MQIAIVGSGAIDDAYYLPGIRGVTAPVFDHSGGVKRQPSVLPGRPAGCRMR